MNRGMANARTNVAMLRIQAGLTQKELARLSGVQTPTISRLENGKGMTEPKTVSRVAAALGVDPLALWNDDVSRARLKYKEDVGQVGPGGALLPPSALKAAAPSETLAGDLITDSEDPELRSIDADEMLARLPESTSHDGLENILKIIAKWLELNHPHDQDLWAELVRLERGYISTRIPWDRRGKVAGVLLAIREELQARLQTTSSQPAPPEQPYPHEALSEDLGG